MGVKFSKRYSSHSYYSFPTKLFVNVPRDRSHKSYLLGFGNFKSQGNFQNATPTVMILFSNKLFLNVPCDGPYKSCL